MLKDSDYLVYGNYRGSINKENGYYWGKILGLKDSLILYEGNNLEELKNDFIACVDDYYAFCKESDRLCPRL